MGQFRGLFWGVWVNAPSLSLLGSEDFNGRAAKPGQQITASEYRRMFLSHTGWPNLPARTSQLELHARVDLGR